jgi:hypothetical protein
MNKMLIIGAIVIVVIAVAAYMYMSGTGYTAPRSSAPSTGTQAMGSAPEINDATSIAASESAESAVDSISNDITSVDTLEIPNVQ